MGKVCSVFTLLCVFLFCTWGVVRTVKAVSFHNNCSAYIERAANANTVDMAKKELKKAIDYAERNQLTEGTVSIFLHNPSNDVGFWYENMKASYQELEKLPENSTPLEKTNVLMKLRESLTDSTEGTTNVNVPEGISIYPNNTAYFLLSIFSLIGIIVFGKLWLEDY